MEIKSQGIGAADEKQTVDDFITGSSFGGGGYTFNDRENNSDIVRNIKKKKRKSKKKKRKTKRKSKRKKHKTKRRK